MRKKLIAVAVLFLVNTVQAAPITFDVKRVSDNVYIAHPQRLPRINATSTIIIGKTFLTVIESQPDVAQAEALIKTIRAKISKLPIKYLVVTHFHLDHLLGSAAFVRENPSVIIIAHENVRQYILNEGEKDKSNWHNALVDLAKQAEIKNDIKNAAALKVYDQDVAASRLVIPELTIKNSLQINDADFSFTIEHIGLGHTTGDLVIYLPKEKIIVTGDLVHDYEPLFWNSADPDEWVKTLEKLKGYDFEFLIGGHGDLQRGKTILTYWTNYMKELITLTKAAMNNGQTKEDFLRSITDETVTTLRHDHYGERIQTFRTGYMEFLPGPMLDAVKGQLENLWGIYSAKK